MFEHSPSRLQWLQSQIADGWQLDAPVIERAAYASANGYTSAFEFVLRHERGCQVVAVPDCPEVRDFLHQRQLESVLL